MRLATAERMLAEGVARGRRPGRAGRPACCAVTAPRPTMPSAATPTPARRRAEQGMTVSSMICDLDERRVYVCAGPPCENPYQVFRSEPGGGRVRLRPRHRQRPHRRRLRQPLVPRRRRRARRAHRGDRRARLAARRGASIDAADRYVTPGFVDPHTHSDVSILQFPRAESAVLQGVTTHVTGNCGMSPAPIVERFRDERQHEWDHYWDIGGRLGVAHLRPVPARRSQATGTAINIAPLVGSRRAAPGVDGLRRARRRRARAARMMRRLLDAEPARRRPRPVHRPRLPAGLLRRHRRDRRALRGRRHATTASTRRTSAASARRSWTRSAEAIEIGRRAGVAVEVSHNAPKWGAPGEAPRQPRPDRGGARRRGQDVTIDNDTHTDLAPRLSRALPQPVSTCRTTRSSPCSRPGRTRATCAGPSRRTRCPAPATPASCGTAASTAS